jgi:vacuolar protein sorting-associated protein IST1
LQVEGVIREDFVIEADEILELFCELLLARLGVIEISK